MKKNFVLDTNVLIHDPNSIFQFADNDVIIPIYALEEVDRFKKELSERGRNARTISRYLDEFRAKGGKLAAGIKLPGGGSLRVAMALKDIPHVFRDRRMQDNFILAVALEVAAASPAPTIFVTKDVNLRVRSEALGLTAQDFEHDKIDIEELYSGVAERVVPGEDVDRFQSEKRIELIELDDEFTGSLVPNQYVMLQDNINEKHTALGRYDDDAGEIAALRPPKNGVWGIRPRNREQTFALDLLLNDDIKLATLVGKAGTGKTLLAIAAGLQLVVEEKRYHRLLVSRPIFPLGRDLGYLPGDIEEKLNPWMQPIFDNVELLMGSGSRPGGEGSRPGGDKKGRHGYHALIDMGYMQIEPLTYIRGRSIPNQFMIVDEAQNLTPHEVKTIITRVGHNTKIVLTGDAYQIDNPYVDSANNGLTYVVERFKGEKTAGHVTLVKGERSALAELAANLL